MEALTLFRSLLTAAEEAKTWEEEVWNLLLVAAEIFWVDKDREPQEYRSAEQRASVHEDVILVLCRTASRFADAGKAEGVDLIYSVLAQLLLHVHDLRIIETLAFKVTLDHQMTRLTHDTINDLLNALDQSRRPLEDERGNHRYDLIDLVAIDLLTYLKALKPSETEFSWSVNRAGLKLGKNGEIHTRQSDH